MTEELEHKAEEYVKKDGTETEKLLNSVKLSLTREEATVLIKCIKQSYIDGATEATKELQEEIKGQKEYIKYLKRQRQGGIQKQYNKVGIIKELKKKLTEAKELLKRVVEWADWQSGSNCPSFQNIEKDIKAFLEEK